MRHILILAVSVSLLLAGCSEKPERQAAKEVRKSTQKATEIVNDSRQRARQIIPKSAVDDDKTDAQSDFDITEGADKHRAEFEKAQHIIAEGYEKARQEIDRAVSQNRQAGQAASSAILTSGNLLFSQAINLQAALQDFAKPAGSIVDNISESVNKISDLNSRKLLLQKLIDANEKDIANLRKVLEEGTELFSGLREQYNNKNDKLQGLLAQKKRFEEKASQARTKSNSIEKEALDKLRQAEKLSGEEKLKLQNEAFDLRLSRKDYALELQSTVDKISYLETKIAVVEPMVQKLSQDITDIEDRIQKIKTERGTEKLYARIGEIQKQAGLHEGSINKGLSDLKDTLEEYNGQVKKINALLDEAIEKYKSAARGSIRQIATARQGASYFWKAGVEAESTRVYQNLILRLSFIADAAESGIASGIDEMSDIVSDQRDTYSERSMKNYEESIAKYENISASGDFDCAIQKTHILALYGKIALAEYLGNFADSDSEQKKYFTMADETAARAEKLLEEAIKCDPEFARSVTIKILQGQSDFVPKLQVSLADYYGEIRKEIQGWEKLSGPAKEAEVKRLLATIESESRPAEDPEAFEQILAPEREKLKAALKKGFDEEATYTPYSSDPNS